MSLRLCRLSAAFLLLLLCVTGIAGASETSIQPHQWPASDELSPQLQAWPNAIRFHGANRYQTNLTTALALRGSGSFPFDSPDSFVAGSSSVGETATWWGAGRCPRAILLVAGDSPADALAAASLSDPSGLSREPYLQRTAAADPLFDPVGGFSRVDTDFAPIIITDSARRGSTSLTLTARYALKDLRSEGCRTARDVIIVGGTSAVPYEVEAEILSLGYDSVYRVSGTDRFSTAAAVANALGTEAIPAGVSGCKDSDTRDGSAETHFYANSVVEWRISDQYCDILGKTAVLTDGITGADALAAGWWTSFWQVPILLHDGSNTLPKATAAALQTLGIDNLIILGGIDRVPELVATEAGEMSGAAIRRVAGEDRYSTSVLMARRFGGWWPASGGSSARSSMLCIVASSGVGNRSVGWSDALGAGAWCSTAAWASSKTGTPERVIGPVSGAFVKKTRSSFSPSNHSMPVILVPYGAKNLPPVVKEFLSEAYPSTQDWCSSAVSAPDCFNPGFAVVFGGSSSVTSSVVEEVSVALSGHVSEIGEASNPFLDRGFVTEISMAPIFHETSSGDTRLCVNRNSYSGTRWLVVGLDQSPVVQSALDASNLSTNWYQRDADDVPRSSGIGSPGCVRVSTGVSTSAWMAGTGVDGRRTNKHVFGLADSSKFFMSQMIETATSSSASGLSTSVADQEGITRVSFATNRPSSEVTMRGETTPILSSSISLVLSRPSYPYESNPTFQGSWEIDTLLGSVIGQVQGETRLIGNEWVLRGKSTVRGGSWTDQTGSGGFSATIFVNGAQANDDQMSWILDALVAK